MAATAPEGYYEREAAHELGHGAFGLEHAWKVYPLNQNSTPNLMDYNNGTELWAGQWKYMHEWHLKIGVGQQVEDGASADALTNKIDYAKLVKWLRENQGKTVDYKFSDFISTEYLTAGFGSGYIASVPIDKDYTETVNGETITLKLKGELSTKDGSLTLIAKNTNIPLEISFTNDNIVFSENIYFDKTSNASTKELAIRLSTYDIETFDRLLAIQEYTYSDKAKIYYKKKFTDAFTLAGNDRNKIDILWENIPDFVALELTDDQKWDNLISLSKGLIDAIGTNEEKAVNNIVKSISSTFLQKKIQGSSENSELLASILLKLSSEYRIIFIQNITFSLSSEWENSTLKYVYVEETQIPDDYRWVLSQGARTADNTLKFGVSYFCKDKTTGWDYDCSDFKPKSNIYVHSFGNEFSVNASTPVITVIQENEIIIPAFLIQPLIEERNSDNNNDFLSLSVNLLLPSALIKAATLAKWGKIFRAKGAGSKLNISELNNLPKLVPEASGSSKVVISNIKNLPAEQVLKLTPQKGSILEQKLNEYIAAVGTDAKGTIGEDIGELLAKELDNTEVLNIKLNNAKQGFDPMAFENGIGNPTKIKIFECKTISPGENRIRFDVTNNGAQMGNTWTRNTINKMRNSTDLTIKETGDVLFKNQDKVERYALTIDQEAKQVIIIRLGDY